MGLDLMLLPYDADGQFTQFSHTMLAVARRRELWPAILALRSFEVKDGFTSYIGRQTNGEVGYGECVETAYGERVRYTMSRHLASVWDHTAVDGGSKNKAVW